MRIGCVHGRFQPFHKGHFEYLVAASQRCDRLIIGITQYERDISDDGSPEHRMTVLDNPFSYWERAEIILSALKCSGLEMEKFTIVPFPIHAPSAIRNFVDQSTLMFTTIYDVWNLRKIRRLQEERFEVCVLWRRKFKEFEGKEVRRAMRRDRALFKSLVPPGVFETVDEILFRAGQHLGQMSEA